MIHHQSIHVFDISSSAGFVLAFACAAVAFRKWLGKLGTRLLSFLINKYLLSRYPIYREGSRETIPSCPYEWPNGQGDVAKFLDGIENRDTWSGRYGRIYRIWSGTSSEIVLTRPEHLKVVFSDSHKHRKAVDNNSGYLMSQVLGHCVGLISGNEWSILRKITEVPFQHKAVGNYANDIQIQVRKYLNDLRKNSHLGQGLLDPALDTKMLPFFVVAQIFYGALSPQLVQDLRDLAPLREKLFYHVIKGGFSRFSVSQYFPTQPNTLLQDFQAQWRRFNNRAYQHAVKSDSNAPIVSMYQAAQSGTITMEQLLQTLDESLYANLDVTTGGLSWNLVFLAANPLVQSKLRDEISRHSHELEAYTQRSSTLLAACILESSRLKPLAAFSVPQSAPTDRVVDGYVIPAGTNFVVDSYALNVRHEFWEPDSETYRPERWLKLNLGELRYHFWRFGFGPRQCMGRYAADSVIRTFLVELLTTYSLVLKDKDNAWGRDPNSWITHPRTTLICEPLGSL
ncbi:cytochrome P450 monooxygenase [Lophiotrema nucula]|uniref:Cytochrome P450 monooxygenase n=1 Tax=Lophiotrema nucula TaxID=690887 RepID=A0A6A5YHD6_9PLEO|nr:cytochrome P450 monooxygenase [Lophiotrema nucula]